MYTTLHTIVRSKDLQTSLSPGVTIDDLTDEEIDDLLRFGAIREATAEEAALFFLANPSKRVAPTSVATGERLALEQRAVALGVKFNKNISDATLADRIAAAEEAAAKAAQPDLGL